MEVLSKQEARHLDGAAIESLTALLGARWISYEGPHLFNGHFAWQSVSIATSVARIEICSELTVLSFDGKANEYAQLRVSETSLAKEIAEADSEPCYQGNGQVIRSIWVIRDELNATSGMTQVYSYSCDVAVVFQLETLWIMFALASHQTETIQIETSPKRDHLKFFPLDARWNNNLDTQYKYSREWILLAGDPGDG